MNENNNNNNNGNSSGEVISWIIILVLVFSVPPLGIILFLKKLGESAKPSKRYETKRAPAAARTEPQQEKKQRKSARSQLDKKTGKPLSVLLLLVSIALIIIGTGSAVDSISDLVNNVGASIPALGMSIFYIISGLIIFFTRNTGVKKISRYKRYNALIGERELVSIAAIADAAGVTVKAATRDIQAMIDAGYLGSSVYIDSGLGAVVLSAEAAEAARQALKRAAQPGTPDTSDKPENQYMAIISELRELNVKIADIPISDKIDKIEELTAKIFRAVEENPVKLPQIRRFMNYYLPTTLKLLHSYETLEKQGVRGENITAAKQNISRILETLATGFEQQLDMLFQDDAIDISADINVLEKMMKQDGLSGEEPEFKTMQSGGF